MFVSRARLAHLVEAPACARAGEAADAARQWRDDLPVRALVSTEEIVGLQLSLGAAQGGPSQRPDRRRRRARGRHGSITGALSWHARISLRLERIRQQRLRSLWTAPGRPMEVGPQGAASPPPTSSAPVAAVLVTQDKREIGNATACAAVVATVVERLGTPDGLVSLESLVTLVAPVCVRRSLRCCRIWSAVEDQFSYLF